MLKLPMGLFKLSLGSPLLFDFRRERVMGNVRGSLARVRSPTDRIRQRVQRFFDGGMQA
jgi:hypothetical protein